MTQGSKPWLSFDLATNFDDRLLEEAGRLGTVETVYGKMAADFIGGGRPSITLPQVSVSHLQRHIATAHRHNIQFNYLLNALCLDNQEFIGPSHRQILVFLDWLVSLGIDAVTIANPYLLRLIKQRFPSLKVSVSIFCRADSLVDAKSFEEMGADEITLDHSFTRNFPLLEAVLRVVRPQTSIRVIANNVCLHECPYKIAHGNLMAHSSQAKHQSGGFLIDYYTLRCGWEKLRHPTKLITSDWIRPEDITFYEELARKAGHPLVIKLTDRQRTTKWLIRMLQAYSTRTWNGNLFDLINFIGNGGYQQLDRAKMASKVLGGNAKMLPMLNLEKATFLCPVEVDNTCLAGFLEGFINRDCQTQTCDDRSWFGEDDFDQPSGSCSYCKNVARQVIRFDEKKRQEAMVLAEKVLADLESSKMFVKR